MDPKSSESRRLLTLRRVSAPTVVTGLTATQKRHREQEQVAFSRAAKDDVVVCSSVHISDLHQRSKMSRRHSSDDGVIRSCLSRLQCSHIPKFANSTLPFRSSKHTTSHYEEGYNGGGWEDSLHSEKNEAEIIGDMVQRRGSLPPVSSSDILRPGVLLSSAAFITVRGHGQPQRKSQRILASSVDRELQCLYKNSKEDKHLEQTLSELDKQSFASSLDFRKSIQKVFIGYQKLVQVSPTVDEWLATKIPHAGASRREHVKEESSNRTSGRSIQCSRGWQLSHGVLPRRQLETDVLADDDNCSDDDDRDAAAGLAATSKGRRHTISGNVLSGKVSQFHKSQRIYSSYMDLRKTS
ncbi:hypothetical protein BsWGS_08805 [Bradybaena similaris]